MKIITAADTWESMTAKLEVEYMKEVLSKLRENYSAACQFNEPSHPRVVLEFLTILILDLDINTSFEYLKTTLRLFCQFEDEEIDVFYKVYYIQERFMIKNFFCNDTDATNFSIEKLVDMASGFLECESDDFFEFLFSSPPVCESLITDICGSSYEWNSVLTTEKPRPQGEINTFNLSLLLFQYDIVSALMQFGQKGENANLSIDEFNNRFENDILNEKFYKIFKTITDINVKKDYIDFLIDFCAINYFQLFTTLKQMHCSEDIQLSGVTTDCPDASYLRWLQFFDDETITIFFKLFDRLFLDYLFEDIIQEEKKFLKTKSFILDEFAEEDLLVRTSKNSRLLWSKYKTEPFSIEKKLIYKKSFLERKEADFLVDAFINDIFIGESSGTRQLKKGISNLKKPKEFKQQPQRLLDPTVSDLDENAITLKTPLKFRNDYMDDSSPNQFNFDSNINKFISNMSDGIKISANQQAINQNQISKIRELFDVQKKLKLSSESKGISFTSSPHQEEATNETVFIDNEEIELVPVSKNASYSNLKMLLDSLINAEKPDNVQNTHHFYERNALYDVDEEAYNNVEILLGDGHKINKNKRVKVSMKNFPKYKYYLKLERSSNLSNMLITPDMLMHAILYEEPIMERDI